MRQSLVRDLCQTSRLGLTVAAVAAAVGVIYGYDLSNIAGALLFITDQFHLSVDQQELVTTAVVAGQVVGALVGGWLANHFGRKRCMVLLTGSYAVFAVLGAVSVSVPMLLLVRLLLGLTVGLSVVTVPVFVAESAPAKVRGALLVAYQAATVVGIILGYLVAYVLADSHNWRWMLGLAAVPALLVFTLVIRLPDTANWYVLTGRLSEARRTISTIEPAADVDAEIAEIRTAMSMGKGGSLREMMRTPYLRATAFVVGLGFFIQITGINAVVYYSPRIFQAMGFTGNFALLVLPALVQVASLAAVFVSLALVDHLGRRPILLGGIGMMIAANALLVGVFMTGKDLDGALTVLGFFGVLLFTVGFTFGFGSLVWVYAGESFPAHLRSLGASAMLTSDLVANVIVAEFFLTSLQRLGGTGTFAVFGVLAMAGFVFVYRLAPETKGRRLEEIHTYWENRALEADHFRGQLCCRTRRQQSCGHPRVGVSGRGRADQTGGTRPGAVRWGRWRLGGRRGR